MKIFLVEDDQEIVHLLRFYLSLQNWEICSYNTYQIAKANLSSEYNIFIFDLLLPDGDGLDLLREAKKKFPQIPCIIISARTSSFDRVKGFEVGTDDYVTKPFLPEELIYRIKKLTKQSLEFHMVCLNTYQVDSKQRMVYEAEQTIELSTKEFDLLEYLIKNKGIALKREQILSNVWGESKFLSDRTIDNQIKNIRKKLPNLNIETVYGYGYRLNG